MAQTWMPIALAAVVGSSFAFWYSLSDWERARYFGLVVGLPVTIFAVIGVFQWGQTQKLKK